MTYLESIHCGKQHDAGFYYARAHAQCASESGEPIGSQLLDQPHPVLALVGHWTVSLCIDAREVYVGTVPTREMARAACRRWAGTGVAVHLLQEHVIVDPAKAFAHVLSVLDLNEQIGLPA